MVFKLDTGELPWYSSYVMDCHATAQGSIPSGMVLKPSFTSFARDIKWGCQLEMTSLLMGRKTQPTYQIRYNHSMSSTQCAKYWYEHDQTGPNVF